MDDQHRWDALGIVDKEVKTPNLDQLANDGVFFDQAVCQAPMCTPSRNSMMLGLYPNQIGILRNGHGVPDNQLPSVPLPEMLKRAGYQTVGFGKTHWGVDCTTRGFETRYVAECLEKGAVMMKDEAPEAKKRYDVESKTMGGGEENNLGYLGFTSPLPEEEHRDGWVTKKCLEFIKSDIDGDRPLFLYLSFLKPHAGHNVPVGYENRYDVDNIEYATQPRWEEDISPHANGINRREMYTSYWSKATDEQWRQMTMRYRANCTWIDDMFGRVINELEEKGILDNALIVYCSDHGEMLGERFYRFNKYCLYESSVRVPIILSGSALPMKIRGKTDHRPAELVDIYPTLLEAAGINVPEKLSGLNLLSDKIRSGSFCALHERKEEAAFMWRTDKHKLILMMKRKSDAGKYTNADIIGGEFYNLIDDPNEWNDLYSNKNGEIEIREKMTKELLEFLKSQGKIISQTPSLRGSSSLR
jgi:arylsulfatase A-like enzyme